MLKTFASTCVLAVLAFTSTTAHAQPVDNRTFFTFNPPVTFPGVTLPAGKYLFRNPRWRYLGPSRANPER